MAFPSYYSRQSQDVAMPPINTIPSPRLVRSCTDPLHIDAPYLDQILRCDGPHWLQTSRCLGLRGRYQ